MFLTNRQIDLLKLVIEAAKEGRYCHGNGADWVIVDKNNKDTVVHINHVTGSISKLDKDSSANYLKNYKPYKSESTASSLTEFIK